MQGRGSLVRKTPLVPVPETAQARMGRVWLKLECLQRTGSFKLRGAVHKLVRMSDEDRARGVMTASAGNHGAGIALAASRAGCGATVVVPEHAPAIKKQRIASMGAEVIVHGRTYDEAEAFAMERSRATGRVFVSAFDDDDVVDGNGRSLGREILEQCEAHGRLARVVCPVGGGGLIGGLAAYLAPRGVSVWGVQPEANCAMHESIEQGRAMIRYQGKPTLAEGCEGGVAERTYQLVAAHVEDIALVSEEAIGRAVAFAYRDLGTVIECSSAVAVAGFLDRVVAPAPGGLTVCILTGSNIESELLDELLARHEPA